MALLKTIEKDQATGHVAEIYEIMTKNMGFIPNAFKVFSASPHILDIQFKNMGYYVRHQTLGGKLLAFIRLLVSEQEKCAYCITMNTGILFQYGVLPDMIAAIRLDPAKAPLEAKELNMLLFVLKVVKDANSIQKADVDGLRNMGWTDAEILEATYHGATQVAVDMIFNAFQIGMD
ncbi:MAG: hypothetical protein M0P58_05830 [Bacteroidales bacterium]|nr:hypothetical protein [Bacteroidales bacterium]